MILYIILFLIGVILYKLLNIKEGLNIGGTVCNKNFLINDCNTLNTPKECNIHYKFNCETDDRGVFFANKCIYENSGCIENTNVSVDTDHCELSGDIINNYCDPGDGSGSTDGLLPANEVIEPTYHFNMWYILPISWTFMSFISIIGKKSLCSVSPLSLGLKQKLGREAPMGNRRYDFVLSSDLTPDSHPMRINTHPITTYMAFVVWWTMKMNSLLSWGYIDPNNMLGRGYFLKLLENEFVNFQEVPIGEGNDQISDDLNDLAIQIDRFNTDTEDGVIDTGFAGPNPINYFGNPYLTNPYESTTVISTIRLPDYYADGKMTYWHIGGDCCEDIGFFPIFIGISVLYTGANIIYLFLYVGKRGIEITGATCVKLLGCRFNTNRPIERDPLRGPLLLGEGHTGSNQETDTAASRLSDFLHIDPEILDPITTDYPTTGLSRPVSAELPPSGPFDNLGNSRDSFTLHNSIPDIPIVGIPRSIKRYITDLPSYLGNWWDNASQDELIEIATTDGISPVDIRDILDDGDDDDTILQSLIDLITGAASSVLTNSEITMDELRENNRICFDEDNVRFIYVSGNTDNWPTAHILSDPVRIAPPIDPSTGRPSELYGITSIGPSSPLRWAGTAIRPSDAHAPQDQHGIQVIDMQSVADSPNIMTEVPIAHLLDIRYIIEDAVSGLWTYQPGSE
jgi:hypothetical protein